MITAIDFGSYEIRCAYRNLKDAGRIEMLMERAEYVVLPDQESCRATLTEKEICFADCEDSIVVFGSRADQVRWLSRRPCAPLFADATVPTDDAPARQILNILTKAMLPTVVDEPGDCWFTTPGGSGGSRNVEFLSRLIRMHGFEPHSCTAGEALMLAAGSENQFTGVCVVMGAETSEISISRFGVELAAETLHVGTNWIDSELARQFEIQIWDDEGNCYIDLDSIREWKHDPQRHLRNTVSEQEKTLSRLYGVVLDQIARSVRMLLRSVSSMPSMKGKRLGVICAGGPTQIAGFTSALTERFVEHDIADRILSIRTVDDAATAVVRGLLIQGELEQKRRRTRFNAA